MGGGSHHLPENPSCYGEMQRLSHVAALAVHGLTPHMELLPITHEL